MAEVETVDGRYTLITPVIMTNPILFEPKAYKENGKSKGEPGYGAMLNFDADSQELKDIKALAAKVAKAAWPDKPFFLQTVEGVRIPQVKFPFKDGNVYADAQKAKGRAAEYSRGKVSIRTKSKFQPALAFLKGNVFVDLVDDVSKAAMRDKFYSGVEVLAKLNFVTYKKDDSYGVTVYLDQVASLGRGARVGGGPSASQTFSGYVGKASAEDPTAPGSSADMSDDAI